MRRRASTPRGSRGACTPGGSRPREPGRGTTWPGWTVRSGGRRGRLGRFDGLPARGSARPGDAEGAECDQVTTQSPPRTSAAVSERPTHGYHCSRDPRRSPRASGSARPRRSSGVPHPHRGGGAELAVLDDAGRRARDRRVQLDAYLRVPLPNRLPVVGEHDRAVLRPQPEPGDRPREHTLAQRCQELAVTRAADGPAASLSDSSGSSTSFVSFRASCVASASSSLWRYRVAPYATPAASRQTTASVAHSARSSRPRFLGSGMLAFLPASP